MTFLLCLRLLGGDFAPGGYVPWGPGGPFIINSQPPYDNHSSAAYHDFYAAQNGPFNTPAINVSQQSGYIMPQSYDGSHLPESGHLIPHSNPNEAGASLAAVEKPEEYSSESIVETLLETNRQEKAPKLIRVYASDEEDGVTGASTPTQCESEQATVLWLFDGPVKETGERIKKEAAAQDRSKRQLTKLTYDSSPTLDSDKSPSGRSQQHRFDISHNGAFIIDSDSISTLGCSRSRSCSPPSRPVDYLVSLDAPSESQQKISLKGGKTIEDIVRRMDKEREDNLSETLLLDVITSLETEQKEKDTQMAKKKVNFLVDSGSSRSRSCSLTRTSSSKSV
ncbi:hypothetical protein N7478_001592 [Penicillium angulare]|uniref:uncharacterized protein n=1 Tax=Penicillium angulare TaxID=116970 RepID=UPI002540124C|nr:uncharacterized protein N7478_001592 [Penicillium angulare]KAJ5288562.1 hypothetical protein N7478_001592 [Penicillium angulare]